ncbi:biotin--[acetyl-CoA-carboxylase] ligase [Hazenella sp. IB182357]|uniref:Bifunctional ligase/repressor BirA n=1 Tax=Polycladospora coralii TaxID=2771432 RepID=A0A926N650_9BACL|nr:biotin--[acetyl-CoA-carboxylase] ligase [Polycladospora coralii]
MKLENRIKHELIRLLLQNRSHFLSGEEMSKQIGCSRMAIWKHIEELRKAGYEIEAKPRSGYRLQVNPDRVSAAEVSAYLTTKRLGQHITYLDTTTSTQTVAHEWAKEGAPEGAIVIADNQTAGRGRLGRNWFSPKSAGIWFSLILRPQIDLQAATQLTLLMSVAVRQAIQKATGLSPHIKWPNDLLINEKKICGILTELRGEQDQIHYVVVGMGMNVNTPYTMFPSELQNQASSLAIETGHQMDRAPLIATLLAEIEALYDEYLTDGFLPIKLKWEAGAGMLGERITARTAKNTVSGIATGLSSEGALLIQCDEKTIPIYSAEIEV